MRQLLAEARRIGVSVQVARLDDDPSLRGYYLRDQAMIVLRAGMTRAESRSVLAHELGHAYHRHDGDSPRAERQADIYAARLLIDSAQYARLERDGCDRHQLAEELEVTVEVVRTFEAHCLARIGGVAYALPRMGARQWAFRAVSA